jgi:predicted Fe-S protein YdhL (DUF1289 family)
MGAMQHGVPNGRSRAPRDARLIEIPSPCVGICRIEPRTGLCAGCLRTSEEIATWPAIGGAQRLAIVQLLRERRRARGITSPADSRPRRRSRALPDERAG